MDALETLNRDLVERMQEFEAENAQLHNRLSELAHENHRLRVSLGDRERRLVLGREVADAVRSLPRWVRRRGRPH